MFNENRHKIGSLVSHQARAYSTFESPTFLSNSASIFERGVDLGSRGVYLDSQLDTPSATLITVLYVLDRGFRRQAGSEDI